MSNDNVCRMMNSYIHHGTHNDRVYLMKMSDEDYPAIVSEIERLSVEKGYSKAFAKVPFCFKDEFLAAGYIEEGIIPEMFRGEDDGYFLSKYYDPRRKESNGSILTEEKLKENPAVIKKCGQTTEGRILPKDYDIRQAEHSDCSDFSALFSGVFESYPFPIWDPSYIRKTMDEGIIYFGIWKDNNLIAASSSETDSKSLSCEMTDFATHNDYRGMGLAGILLDKMENEMKNRGFITAYTIARASFLPVNTLFFSRNYTYAGTLINNTNICGSFESMNLWYKKL